MRHFIFLIFFLCSAATAFAQDDAPPQEGFTFLDLPFSARTAVLGEGYAPGTDVTAFFQNPAALKPVMDNALALSYINHLADFNGGMAAYSLVVPGVGVVGGGVRYLSYGSFDEATRDGERTGSTFGAGDLALTVGLARGYGERFRYGGAVNAVYSRVAAEGAFALALGAGALYDIPEYQLALSASVTNLGTALSSVGTSAPSLPLDVRLGVTKVLAYLPLAITLTGHHLHRPGFAENTSSTVDAVMHHLSLGGELRFSEAFQLRAGYNHHRHQTLKMGGRLDFAGFGAGFGLALAGFKFDYAFSSWSSLGGLHYLTVRTQL